MLKVQLKWKVDFWAIEWSYAYFRNNSYCLNSVIPLCKNIGLIKVIHHRRKD